MTELTERLMRERLQEHPQRTWAYHNDAAFHADWWILMQALDHTHTALVASGDDDADRIVEILSLGLPSTLDAMNRSASSWRPR